MKIDPEILRAVGIDPSTIPDLDAPRPEPPSARSRVPDPEADLTDEEAAALEPFLPALKSSSTVTNIDVLNAAIWRARTGRPLTHLPERFGSSEVIRKRLEHWAIIGAWDDPLARIDELDLSEERRREIGRIAERLAAKGARIRAMRRA